MNKVRVWDTADEKGGRASTLRDKLGPKDRQVGDEEAETWKKEVEMLKGEDDKMMFSKVPIDKKVIG